MAGSIHFPMSEQIADTIRAHGALWAAWHYCANPQGPKLSAIEWRILSRQRPAPVRPVSIEIEARCVL